MAASPEGPSLQTPLADLLGYVAEGDRVAFNLLYDRVSPKLFAVILRILGNRVASEDVLQASFIKIWKNADQFRHGGGLPMPWLITLARNTAFDWLRQRPDVIAVGEEFDPLADDLPTLAEMEAVSLETPPFYRRFGHLDDRTQDLIRRAYYTGGPYEDLARKVRMPMGPVRSILREALALLGGAGAPPSNVHRLRSDPGE